MGGMEDLAPYVLYGQPASELLTTGEAARLLNSSRQHVVDLCDSGELPYERTDTTGSHRRNRRGDLAALVAALPEVREEEDALDILGLALTVRDSMIGEYEGYSLERFREITRRHDLIRARNER